MIKIGNFPETVNENAARLVALFVFILSVSSLYFHSLFLTVALLYGFTARLLYGPKFDLFARLSLHIIIPLFKINDKPTSGIPKRFAQFIGFIFSLAALILILTGKNLGFEVALSILSFFAFLESILGFCAGCFLFGYFMKWGIIPETICERCNNIDYHI